MFMSTYDLPAIETARPERVHDFFWFISTYDSPPWAKRSGVEWVPAIETCILIIVNNIIYRLWVPTIYRPEHLPKGTCDWSSTPLRFARTPTFNYQNILAILQVKNVL
jgi:hypothetical protein